MKWWRGLRNIEDDKKERKKKKKGKRGGKVEDW